MTIGSVATGRRRVALWFCLGPWRRARTAQCAALCAALLPLGVAAELHLVSLATNAASIHADAAVFVTSYDDARWSGAVTAFMVSKSSGAVSSTGLWGTAPGAGPASTATLMDSADFSPAERVVLSAKATATGSTVEGSVTGIPWTWDALTEAQRAALGTPNGLSGPDALGPQRLAYLRGDRSRETPGEGLSFRRRASRHGDIVNSKLWHLGGAPASGYTADGYSAFKSRLEAREAMLYVGANDGMLHGFSARTGKEKIAYVPLGVSAQLAALTTINYTHRYFVDGSPLTADLIVDGSWKTYLAGFLGAGGVGYFVLDVSDPSTFNATNASRLVVLDQTTASDPDIGQIHSVPVRERSDPALTRQITQLNDGRWALVTGNGYDSASGKAILLIQYLDGDRKLRRIPATNQPLLRPAGVTSNGLSAPRLIDLNGDLIPDVAYAGDLVGNLWKFDLSSSEAGQWKAAFNGTPLYTAKHGKEGKAQPITSAPVWLAHPLGGILLVFGTGRNLSDADQNDSSVQTVYGVYDNSVITRSGDKVALSGGGPISSGRSALVGQEIGPAASHAADGRAWWTVSSRAVAYAGANPMKGWYLDLPPGERVLANPGWFDGQLIDLTSTAPSTGKTWLTTLNGINGNAPKSPIHAYAQVLDAGSGGTPSRVETGLRVAFTTPSSPSETGICAPGPACVDRVRLARTALRPSWRQLQ